ncbi:hypothetical protein BDDG_11782 [Blastomyces dermatitidis ATCC 18188]|uniref:Uncharacterized protein n=1 Tax=Ajellomyces dermatitidis (strain ATCC 18188 / CBS 674.68) TaxID=653446 RepID=A0A0J9ENQ6_AJEDA|nr:hypothetical protein BDDG_11782 [Blastomyces dermatitidis ATCC 18188]
MNDLEAQAHAMQLLNTSAREAQNARFMQNTGMTVGQQIHNQSAKLNGIRANLAAVRDAIELLSHS